MSDQLAATIAQAANSGATLRTGTVVGITGSALSVNIGGGRLDDIPYLRAYLPILGDQIQILQQGALNLVVDAADGPDPGNPLANGSFEADDDGTSPPTGWAITQAGTGDNTVTVETATEWGPKDGANWLHFAHGVTAGLATVQVVSDPITVSPGEVWSAVAWTVTNTSADMYLKLALFDDPGTAYPGYITEPVVQKLTGPTGPRWTPLRAIAGPGILIPDGATALRVVLAVQFTAGSVWFDQAAARKLPQ